MSSGQPRKLLPNTVREHEQKLLFHTAALGRTKPLLKWAGGKTQLLPILRRAIPDEFERYVEPFLGGAALFWNLALPGSLLADTNAELIHFYSVVRDHPQQLLDAVRAMVITKRDFYTIRAQNPDGLSAVARAARFIYLNKTCYNGLYRVNRKGEFNTPFAGKTNVTILDEQHLSRASAILKHSELVCADFSVVLSKLKPGDFVYLDPPYLPLGGYSDFNRYTKKFFTKRDHVRLAKEFAGLESRGVKALLSNSCNETIEAMYEGFSKVPVQASRQINCRGDGRGRITELLIANYPLETADVLP